MPVHVANGQAILYTAKNTLVGEVNIVAYKITDACIACGVCKDECPVSCISEGDIYVIDAGTCIDCDACAGVCPVDACVAE